MPLVDVTELLIDPDIAGQSFVVLRRQEIVNQYGESTWVVGQADVIGSVQPSGDNALIREADYDAQASTIIVLTSYRLRGVAKAATRQYKPDIIFWRHNFYEVTDVKDWSQFGAGMIEAIATSVHNIARPAGNLPAYAGQLIFTRSANAIYAHGASGGI